MKRIAIIAACVVAVVVLWKNRPVWLTPKERQVVNQLTDKMETRCVGRYTIDVPSDVKSFAFTRIDDVSVEATPMSQDEFRHTVSVRESVIRKTEDPQGYQYLYEAGDGPVPNTRYFVRLSDSADADMSKTVEAYKWHAGHQIVLKVEATDMINSAYVKRKAGTPYGIRESDRVNDVPAKKALIFDMLSRVEGRDPSTIPSQPGVCFPGGFLTGKAGSKEVIIQQFVLSGHPDVSFDLETDTSIQESDTLLDRGSAVDTVLRNIGGRTIRKGNVDLGGWAVQEWLLSGKTTWGIQGNHMTLEGNSKIGSPATPLLTLDMDTGSENNVAREKLDNASLSEAEAVTLWDAVSRTLRPRPNGF